MTYRIAAALLGTALAPALAAQSSANTPAAPDANAARKQQLIASIDKDSKQIQVMVDTLFSFGELGFQEFETSKYLTAMLEKNGFKVERGIDGIPTAWMATWTNGTGGPTIALGSDLDCIPQASQNPASATTIPSSPVPPATAKATTPATSSTSWLPSQSSR